MKGLKFFKKTIKKNFKFVIIGVVALSLFAFVGKYLDSLNENKRLHQELVGKTDKYKQLTDYVANLERKYVEQKELTRVAEEQFGRERGELKGRIKVLSNATYLIRERARRSNSSDLVYEGKGVKYVFNEIRFQDGPPIGYVLIFDDGRVVSKVYNHSIDVKTAVSRDEDSGKYNILSKADYVLRSGHRKPDGKNWFGVPYPMKITGGTALIDPTEPNKSSKRFYLWAPRYNFGVNFNKEGAAPGIGASLMGYGYSKRDLDFKFLELGLQYEEIDGIGFTFKPLLWRPFSDTLPNTYIGPGMSYDKSGQDYFLGISVGF
ncbi:MAG: hypothetical protein R3213_05945 [Flavobacteriaceae bacterium]|nr:hypothetical protein [Flavobacteriaceae bacterium]